MSALNIDYKIHSDNNLFFSKIGWKPSKPLRYGMEKTYAWISEQIKMGR